MQLLSHILRKAVSTKKLLTTGYTGIILHTLSEMIGEKVEKGYLQHGILWISLSNQGKKIYIFRQKQSIITKLHQTLQQYGYSIVIKDIRYKL